MNNVRTIAFVLYEVVRESNYKEQYKPGSHGHGRYTPVSIRLIRHNEHRAFALVVHESARLALLNIIAVSSV